MNEGMSATLLAARSLASETIFIFPHKSTRESHHSAMASACHASARYASLHAASSLVAHPRSRASSAGCGAARGSSSWSVASSTPNGRRSKSAAGASEDASSRAAKAALWQTWWFEARNADALAVLAKMPDADVDAKTKSRIDPKAKQAWVPGGHTAVILAAQRDDPRSIFALRDLGADLNAADDNGATALHHAAFCDAAGAIRALIECGADGDARDERDGSTPAILAAYGSRRNALAALLESDVDLTARDFGNATVAGHCAQRRLREELTKILVACGPGGAGGLRRGEKVYLSKKKELTGQLEVLDRAQLREIARAWRARPAEDDDRNALIVKLLQATP